MSCNELPLLILSQGLEIFFEEHQFRITAPTPNEGLMQNVMRVTMALPTLETFYNIIRLTNIKSTGWIYGKWQPCLRLRHARHELLPAAISDFLPEIVDSL